MTDNRIEDVRVYDVEGLTALPVGIRLHSASLRSWGEISEDERWWELHENGLWYRHHSGGVVTQGYEPSPLMFYSAFGRRMSRRVLNPELLGEFHVNG